MDWRYENAKNWLCLNSGIKLIRIIPQTGYKFENCKCVRVKNGTADALNYALTQAFKKLKIPMDIDVSRDFEKIRRGLIMRRIKRFIVSVLLPLAIAAAFALLFRAIYTSPEGINYLLMWICIGIPFGIHRMCVWLVPTKFDLGTIGIVAVNIISGYHWWFCVDLSGVERHSEDNSRNIIEQ